MHHGELGLFSLQRIIVAVEGLPRPRALLALPGSSRDRSGLTRPNAAPVPTSVDLLHNYKHHEALELSEVKKIALFGLILVDGGDGNLLHAEVLHIADICRVHSNLKTGSQKSFSPSSEFHP